MRHPPCMLGEHNEYVYKDLLGVTDDEYAQLERDGHIGTEYRASHPIGHDLRPLSCSGAGDIVNAGVEIPGPLGAAAHRGPL